VCASSNCYQNIKTRTQEDGKDGEETSGNDANFDDSNMEEN